MMNKGYGCSSWRTSKYAAGIVFFVCALILVPLQARAWSQLSSGRTAVIVKGVRLALPSSGDLDLVTLQDIKHGKQMTLEQVLSNPKDAASMFDAADQVTVVFGNVPSRVNFILEEYPKNDLPTVNFSIVVDGNALVGCSYWERKFKSVKAALTSATDKSTGWVLAEVSGKPESRLYVFVSKGVPDKAVPGISCDVLRACHVSTCAGPIVSTTYLFNERRVPQRDWLKIATLAKKVFSSVLIDENN